tara:strand:+ start:258 stop:1124 length:867 start_codon:yes stop_codon:yes gene_type:complete
MKLSRLITILLILFTAVAAGCSTTSNKNNSKTSSNKVTKSMPLNDPCLQGDPYEKFNRKFYNVTESLDDSVFAPVADTYVDSIPDSVRESVGNFYANLAYPNVALNGLLQGKVKQGASDSLRFIVNTTVGLGGIFDPASSIGLEKHDEDFGQTLGVWGVDNTSYVYLPILGPSSNRDVIGLPVTIASNMLFYAGFVAGAPVTIPLGLLGAIDKRAQYSEQMRIRDQAALDRYIFTREAYWQHRENLVLDGKSSTESYDNLFLDEDLDEELYGKADDRYLKNPCPDKSS